jgi:hypothetical protein
LKFKDAVHGPITECWDASVRDYISARIIAVASISAQITLSSERDIGSRKAKGPLDAVISGSFTLLLLSPKGIVSALDL